VLKSFRFLSLLVRGYIPPPQSYEISAPRSVDIELRLGKGVIEVYARVSQHRGHLWINPGLRPVEGIASQEIVPDPDTSIVRVRRVEPSGPRMRLVGRVARLFSEEGSYIDKHVLRATALWYPGVGGSSILCTAYMAEHEAATLFVEKRGFDVASSLPLKSESGISMEFRGSGRAFLVEVVALRDASIARKCVEGVDVRMIMSRGSGASVSDLEAALAAAIDFYRSLDLEMPFSSMDLVIADTGSFTSGRMLVINSSLARYKTPLLLSIVHGLAHVWWLGFIKPASPEDVWLFEAVPEYLTTISLAKFGLTQLHQKRLNEVFKEALRKIPSPLYTPPNRVFIAVRKGKDSSWRRVGEALLHMVGACIGTPNMLRSIAEEMRMGVASTTVYRLSWRSFFSKLAQYGPVEGVLKRFRMSIS